MEEQKQVGNFDPYVGMRFQARKVYDELATTYEVEAVDKLSGYVSIRGYVNDKKRSDADLVSRLSLVTNLANGRWILVDSIKKIISKIDLQSGVTVSFGIGILKIGRTMYPIEELSELKSHFESINNTEFGERSRLSIDRDMRFIKIDKTALSISDLEKIVNTYLYVNKEENVQSSGK